MREIKFRAWDDHKKKMYSFDELDFLDQFKEVHFYTLIKGEYADIKPSEYTGLKDKNGVEIYEGDILEYPDLDKGVYLFKEQPKRRSVMKWHEQDAAFKIPGTGFRINTERVEVVGNVWENGGLLDDRE